MIPLADINVGLALDLGGLDEEVASSDKMGLSAKRVSDLGYIDDTETRIARMRDQYIEMLFLLKKLILVLDFELYIFTKACHPYALEMANLLDSKGVYFDLTRVFSREHCDQEALKHLDWVPGSFKAPRLGAREIKWHSDS
ncbi:hypothetical protein RJ639_028027 [Escallonia herrerae]|uniref:FCP1 homology domain-containing protein n=1 Tax=Escallonia herrerae TaxID=1293975 RepID=A0AA88X2U9_9ASTE|nr:hypothetical protein RJ639_028027 [Escallonia herrerae]